MTQDLATVVNLNFALVELYFIVMGCMAGLEGCAVGALTGELVFNGMGGNLAETILSGASLFFTGTADILDDGEFSEVTITSAATFGAGTLMFDPIGDLAIDGYSSGYNHGIFNGILTVMNGGSIFK